MSKIFKSKAFKTTYLIIGIFGFVVFLFSQSKSEALKIKEQEEKAFNINLESLVKKSNYFVDNKAWDSVYNITEKIYLLGKDYKKFKVVKPLLYELVDKIPAASPEYKARGNLLINWVETKLGNIFTSNKYLNKVIADFTNHKDSSILLKAYNSLGIFYIKTRDYNKAIQNLSSSAKLALVEKDTIGLARAYYNMAFCYTWARNQLKARQYYDLALKLNPEYKMEYNLNISRTYLFDKNFSEAINNVNLALKYNVSSDDKTLPYFANSMLGEIYLEQKEYKTSIESYQKAFAIRNEIQDKREIIKTMLPLSKAYLGANEINKSLAILDTAINIIGYDRKVVDGKTLPSEMYLIELFEAKGKCYAKKYSATKDMKDLNQSEKHYDKSIEVLYDMRQFQDNPFAIEEMSRKSKDIFESSIANCVTFYEHYKDEKYLDKAFLLAQKHGSFNLRKSVSERKALDVAVKDEATKQKYLKTKIDLLNAEYKLNNEYTDEGFKEYNTTKETFQSLQKNLEKTNAKFKKMMNKIEYVDKKDIQSGLSKDDVFISYFTGSDNIYAFDIYKNKFSYHKVENNSSFKQQSESFLRLLAEPELYTQLDKEDSLIRTFRNASFNMYNSLVKPAVEGKGIGKIIIVPDGFLFRLPFAAFCLRPEGGWNEKNDYLIAKYKINYLYYPAQFLKQENKAVNDYFVGVGLEYDKYTLESMKEFKKDSIPSWINEKFRSESLTHLPFADDEVKEISNHFSGKVYVNEKATKANLMKDITGAGILHISAHSCVDFEDPTKSAIVLTKNKDEQDNLLQYDDITSLDLNSQLIALSACNSSSGKMSEAEGVSSLAKAFFEAGGKSVLGTYWSVPDQISKIMMELFYKKLDEGMSKDDALREVQLEFMTNSDLINPYYQKPQYWSAWTIYGNTDPIEKSYKYLWYWALVGIMLLFGAMWYKRNRSVSKT